MKIDKIDKKILFELEKNARIPHTQLAKKVNRSKDTVRYRINKLEKNGVITGYRTWIDYTKLGYRTATICMHTVNLPSRKQDLIDELIKNPKTYWYGVAEGAWNIAATFFITTNQELFELKNALLSKYHDLISRADVTSLASLKVRDKGFLIDETLPFISFSESHKTVQLDSLDKDILSSLYNNSTKNISQIARDINSTIDVVRYRLTKLEDARIIVRYSIYIDYQKLGYQLYKTSLYLGEHNIQTLKHMVSYAETSSSIINIVQQIAPWDFEFVLFEKNYQEYLKTIEDLTQRYPRLFSRYETAIMSEDVIYPCDTPNL